MSLMMLRIRFTLETCLVRVNKAAMLKFLLKDSFWLLVGSSIGRFAMFLGNIIAARMLPQEVFGQFSMIRNTISSIEGLISGTLGSTIVKTVAQDQEDQDALPKLLLTMLIINISFMIVVCIALYLNIEYTIKNYFLDESALEQSLFLGGIILISSSASNLIQNILIGMEEFKKISIVSILTSVLAIPFIYVLTNYLGMNGALLGVILYYTIDTILKFFLIRGVLKKVKFDSKFFRKKTEKILKFVYPIFLTCLVNGFIFWYARVLLIEKSNGFREVAIFDAAFQWLTIIMIITAATTNVALPKFSKKTISAKKNKNLFILGLSINIIISVVLALIFILFSKNIMSIYGEEYIFGAHILEILCFTSIAYTMSIFLNGYNIAKDRSWIVLFASLFGACSMCLVIWTNIEIFDVKILAWSFFSYYLGTVLVYASRIKNVNL